MRGEEMAERTFRQREDSLLLSLGFDRMEEELWRRDGIYFGREAALQTGQRELLERDGYTVYNLYEQTLGDEESEAS
jgi:hypothetical protein